MATTHNNLSELFTDIADSIRAKTGSTDAISADNFPTAIDAISSSSSSSKLPSLVDRTITEVAATDLQGATNIGVGAFWQCENLTSVTIPENITYIKEKAFTSCSELVDIVIPDSVTKIGFEAFSSCSKLITINLPNTITSISSGMFYYCTSLTNIVIPNSVTKIEHNAFYGCHSLTSLTISNEVTSIGANAFYDCKLLTSITIPSGVTSIGAGSLEIGTSKNKATITMKSTTPPTIQKSTFNSSYLNKIIVPAGTANTYKSATNWAVFANYIQEEEV